MKLGLDGKTALITGGSKGIGRACAVAFAAEGCALHLVARDKARLEAAREAIRAEHSVAVHIHAADLRDGETVRRVAAACADTVPVAWRWRVARAACSNPCTCGANG